MREFFRGWRQKVGIALLVMAWACMGMWGRSLWYQDEVRISRNSRSERLVSNRGLLIWGRGLSWDNDEQGEHQFQ